MRYLFAIFLILPTVVCFADNGVAELQSRFVKLHENYFLNDDFTVVRVSEIEIQALTREAVKQLKKQRFSHSTSIERFEVLEAYTRKADGTKVAVPKGNYQITVNKGNNEAAAVFSDRTAVTIVFPDLEVNDSVFMRVKGIETEPMFPGHFSTSGFFYRQTAHDDVKVVFNLPQNVEFKYEVRDMDETAYNKDGRRIIELNYANKKPVRNGRADFTVWDEATEPGFAISTFSDYQLIAAAYAERALPKALPTERVKNLARDIVKNEKDKRAKARVLYEWVATNISYAGNCIGVGAVVPHDTDFILDNRMGDCKDHATLLEALYRSVGIESRQALINADSRYKLPNIPLVTAVNHVINYIPEWDQYVDSTNPSMPFDTLAIELMDKPVIVLNSDKGLRRTPAMRPGEHSQELVSRMKIQADGSIKGDLQISLKGLPAVTARLAWRNITAEQEGEWLERSFSSSNKAGFATIVKDDPTPLLSEFNYSLEFEKPEFLLAKGTGGFYIHPLSDGPQGVFSYLDYSKEEIHGYDVECGNGYASERLVYEFPRAMKILAKPDDFEIKENHLYYKATYQLDGNRLTVDRVVDDRTPANVCSADLINQQRLTLMKITDTLRTQVIYQH